MRDNMKYIWVILAFIAMWLSFYIGNEINAGSYGWWSFPYMVTCVILILSFIRKALEYKW